MKPFLLILCSLLVLNTSAQCECNSNPDLKELIDCSENKFDNGASVFWSFTCDSSWLSFKSPGGESKILYSLWDLIGLTGRIGYDYAAEYKSKFLIQNRLISGCCTPPEYILFDKVTGKEKMNLGPLVFYSNDRANPFATGFRTSGDPDLNTLVLYNIDLDKDYAVSLPKGEIERALEETGELYVEYLFVKTKITNGFLILDYSIKKGVFKTLEIDLSKYRG
jgi:hypothetical protein